MIHMRTLPVVASALAVLLLAGCAGRELQRTEGFLRPATSASARFYVPATLSLKIVRAGYGSYARPAIGPSDRAYAQKELTTMFGHIERQLNARLGEALRQAGLPPGDDLVLALDVEEAFHTDMGPGAVVNVRALFKGAPVGTPAWSFKFQALSSAVDDAEKTAGKFVDKVMQEVEAAGILRPSGAR